MKTRISYGVHGKAILTLGLPIIGSHQAQMLLHVTDTVLLGWYDVEALAAVVLAASFFFMLFILGSGFGIALLGGVAAALGRGDETGVRRETRMGMWLSILFSVLTIPLFWWSAPLLIACGQEPGTSMLAQEFLRIAGWGMAPALIVMVLKSTLAALERTQVVLWVTLAAAGLNFCVAWAFIFGHWGAPELGVRGAALASLFTQTVTCLALMAYAGLSDASRRFNLFQRFWRPDWQAFWQVARLGLPVGLTGLAESGLFIAAAVMMGWIGTAELAAHGIAMELTAVAFMVHLGLSNAATVRVGRALGEGDRQAMGDAARAAILLSAGFAGAMILTFLFLPEPLIRLFLDPEDPLAPRILAIGTGLLAVGALFQLFDAMQAIALGLLRGVQDTQMPLVIAAFSYWMVGVTVSYLLAFPLGMEGTGLWLGLAVGLALAALLLMARFWRGVWFTAPA
ncbi:MAG: MATE family efflux transporter [Paracoccaceae bacterium]